jgi:hypothetical protein
MKIKFKFGLLLFILAGYTIAVPTQVSAQRVNVNFQVFYDQLSPYGEWTSNSDYGYIWIPDVGPEFSPYSTNGSWVMTDYGWTWVSDYEWGWAPFHYGRWDFDNYYGWFWVPDNEWGPSWVTWRRGNGYYGWAPMRPGISVSMSFGNGYADVNRWNFVRDRDFGRPNMGRYYVNRRNNDMIFRSSSVIINTYNDNSRNVTYISGPRAEEVQRYSGRRISNVSIQDNDRPGQQLSRNKLEIYRPQFDRNNNSGQRSAPSRVSEMKDIRPPAERNPSVRRNNIQQQQQRQQPAVIRQEQIRQTDQKQPVENRRNDQQRQKEQQSQQQQMQQQQQQDDSRRNDLQKQKEEQQQQQQSESRRQDQQQQQKQSVQQNEQSKQDASGSARSKRIERQQNKANTADKKEKRDGRSNQENR